MGIGYEVELINGNLVIHIGIEMKRNFQNQRTEYRPSLKYKSKYCSYNGVGFFIAEVFAISGVNRSGLQGKEHIDNN